MRKEDNLTLGKMKCILLQWKEKDYYHGSLDLKDKKEYLELFWSAIMNLGFLQFE